MEAIKYLSAQEIAISWGITKRRVQNLCVNKRIPGAIRIGNMWAIPSDVEKPKDGRMHEHTSTTATGTANRKMRRRLKKLVESSMEEFTNYGLSHAESLHTLIVLFAAKLIEPYLDTPSSSSFVCEDFFHHKITDITVPNDVLQKFKIYIEESNNLLDDTLAWVYQFGSKNSDEFLYKDTQFFTEKYMIHTLVDSVHVDSAHKIIDPACGGGNFLLYSFDNLYNSMKLSRGYSSSTSILEKLYGYEIDRFLAFVAAFNLKLKVISRAYNEKKISLEEFRNLHTNVYYPKFNSVAGFLDLQWENQIVINCDDGSEEKLSSIFHGADIVITNPPFRTIKGMPVEQKNYLQSHYPTSKCDMCNAFIERIANILPTGGKAAMVTQNSWMYLDSFTDLREKLLNEYTVNEVWELGSNAFLDLSGEKANVALVTFQNAKPSDMHKVRQHYMRNMTIEDIEKNISKPDLTDMPVLQKNIIQNSGSRFDMVSTEHLKKIIKECDKYGAYGIPMQGTSTGDAKKLIDYFWNHIGDEDWKLVSKGGGYSRFEGLNSYCVKWGEDGEFIKATKGSAIRNAKYFDQTQLVFSDTGTAGLNVRILMPKQIFVASGPGIRIIKGKTMAHLAFLNSRFASFFVRLFSPKLTIAAGYIGQIPVTRDLLNSRLLEENAIKCLTAKKYRLSKRPNSFEFSYIMHDENKTIKEMAYEWFVDDLKNEWQQLLCEQRIEEEIYNQMNLDENDIHAIDTYIGMRKILNTTSNHVDTTSGFDDVSTLMGTDCFPKRTKVNKKSLGTDGIIEYVAQTKCVSCEQAYGLLLSHYELFEDKYLGLYMHALVMSAMKYKGGKREECYMSTLLKNMGVVDSFNQEIAKQWIETKFNIVHTEIFDCNPLLKYNFTDGKIMWETTLT